jgi:hypothetical protein
MTTSANTNDQALAELAFRESDGVEVSLLWNRAADTVSVFVADTRSGDAFELPVEGESPLEVFNHPYAFAAFRGIDYRIVERTPASV